MTMPSTSTDPSNVPAQAPSAPLHSAPAQPSPAPAAAPPAAGVGGSSNGQLEIAAAVARPAERVPTRKLVADADEELPADADLIEMSPALLKKRLDRFTRKQLRDRFGTEDMDAVKRDLDELATMRAEREEKRLADLSETERLREQMAQMQQRAEQAEARAEQIQTERVVAEQDQSVTAIMRQHINPRYLKHEARNLAEYVSGLSDAELADPDTVIEAWCRQAIAEDPALAIPQPEAPSASLHSPPPPPARPPVVVPMSNGANVQRPAAASPGGVQGPATTYAPGRQNSASDRDWRELKRANGWNF